MTPAAVISLLLIALGVAIAALNPTGPMHAAGFIGLLLIALGDLGLAVALFRQAQPGDGDLVSEGRARTRSGGRVRIAR